MFSEREASSILRGSGLAGDELHRRRDRGTVVGRVARREVDAEHRVAKNGKKFKEQVSAATALVAFEWVFGATCEPLNLAPRVSLASLLEAEVA